MPLPVARPLSKYTRNGRYRKARDASPESESVNQFCIGHLLKRVRAPDPEAPHGAVVGDAAKVSARQPRRCGLQADAVAVVQAKWRAQRAAPSARALNASRANTWWWGGGGGRGRTDGMGRSATPGGGCEAPRSVKPVAGLEDWVVMHHRHPFESQPRYCRTHAARQSTFVAARRWGQSERSDESIDVGHSEGGLDLHHHHLFAVDGREVELPAPLTVVLQLVHAPVGGPCLPRGRGVRCLRS